MEASQQLQRLLGAGGGEHFVSFVDQDDARQLQIHWRVVDDQYRLTGHRARLIRTSF